MAEVSTLDLLNTLAGYLSLGVSAIALGFGVAGYRKAASVKRLDLRLEYRRKKAAVDFAISRCSELLPRVKKSRLASFSADGLLKSGHKVAFEQEWDEWSAFIDMRTKANASTPIEGMNEGELEKLLGGIEVEELEVSDILAELERSLELDAKNVERRRSNLRNTR